MRSCNKNMNYRGGVKKQKTKNKKQGREKMTIHPNVVVRAGETFYRSRNEVEKVIFKYACVSGAAALLPFPIAAPVINLSNQLLMYGHINRIMKVSFSKNIMKCIGKFILSQLGGLGIGLGVAILSEFAKWIPGAGTAFGSVTGALIWPTVTYSCGWIYYKTLISLQEKNVELTEENMKAAITNLCSDKEAMEALRNEAKEQFKNVDFSKYKEDAQKVEEKIENSFED